MRRSLMKSKVLTSLLNSANPFCLLDENGQSIVFANMTSAYLAVLKKIYALSPRGYVESPLVVKELYPALSFNECKVIAEELEKLGCSQVFMDEWSTKSMQKYAEGLLRGLCVIYDTDYSQDYFKNAWDLLQLHIEQKS